MQGRWTCTNRTCVCQKRFIHHCSRLEICLRNHIHTVVSSRYGNDWLTDSRVAPLTSFSRSFIDNAIRAIDGDLTTGKIVAELKFAFWVGLMGRHYDATLWRRAIYRCFLANGGRKRSVVHGRFNAIRRFRNRIAHHEPIFHRPTQRMHTEIIEAIGWMCPHTRDWTAYHSRVVGVLNDQSGLGTADSTFASRG